MKRKKQTPPSQQSERFLRKLLNTRPDFLHGDCRITFEVGSGLLIEGIRSVSEYTETRFIAVTCSRLVIIEGCHLCICSMMEDSMVICGQITAVRFA